MMQSTGLAFRLVCRPAAAGIDKAQMGKSSEGFGVPNIHGHDRTFPTEIVKVAGDRTDDSHGRLAQIMEIDHSGGGVTCLRSGAG